ncbi:MAG: multidrug efflux system membrane fusion protein [Desulforhopalus sp.]|jgi:multidrug efflux system membrane fusion protein
MIFYKNIICIAVIALITCSYGIGLAEVETASMDGVTKPVADIELSFVQPGKIKSIIVAEGDAVQADSVLVTLEDDIELIQKKILTGRRDNHMPMDLAEVELIQKKKNLENLMRAQVKGATSQWEVDHAALAVDTALLNLKVRQFEHTQDVLKLESLMGLIKRLTLKSPIEGIVEEVLVERGETVQAMVPVVRLVQIDPLVIDLPVPVELAVELKVGQMGKVKFLDATELDGSITHIASIADAAATTLAVTLQVENGKRRPAGERVSVIFD